MENIQTALTIEQAAEKAGVDRGTLYRAITAGTLSAVLVPERGRKGQLYILPRDLENYGAKPAGRPKKRKEGEG